MDDYHTRVMIGLYIQYSIILEHMGHLITDTN